MQNWHRHYWRPILTTLFLAAFTLLIAACSGLDSAPAVPSELQNVDMSQTIERLQKIGPELQRQLDAMEKLNPDATSNCSPAYPEKCIPPAPPELDCEDIVQRNFWVLSPDPHNFDPDGNGLGCEG